AALLLSTLLLSGGEISADDSSKKGSASGERSRSAEIAVFELKGPVTETPTPDDPLFGAIGSESLKSLLERMDQAAADDDVAGVVLLLGDTSLGYAQLLELRAALDRLKDAEKPVYSHAD